VSRDMQCSAWDSPFYRDFFSQDCVTAGVFNKIKDGVEFPWTVI